jgi:hypothetical protein
MHGLQQCSEPEEQGTRMLERPLTRRVPTVLAAALLAACSESAGPSGERVASMQIVSGDAQQAVVGTELPASLVVKAVDATGAVLSGQSVNFRVVAGGGSVFAGSSITNADGIAQERWTLGTSTADSQRVEARAVDNVTGAPLPATLCHRHGNRNCGSTDEARLFGDGSLVGPARLTRA